MHLIKSVFRFAAILCLASLAPAGQVAAQAYPAKPVKLIVPFPPGGPADVLGRLFAEKLGAMWNQPVIVENRAGAAGNIGSEVTAKSAPDGYTLLLIASSHVINGGLYDRLPYDPIKDFTPVSQVAYYSLVMVVHPSVAAHTMQELIAWSKANPGKLSLASAGNGTPTHLAAELFRGVTGINFAHIPYKGAAPATNDLLAGHAQLMFNNPVSALPLVKSGRLRALATTGLVRSPLAADVPTVAESGYPGFEAGTWYAFIGPAGMPGDIVHKLAADINAVLRQEAVRARFIAMGVDPIGTTPEQLAAVMRSDLEKWTKVIRAANIKAD